MSTNTLKDYVNILQCPPEFELSETQPECICAVRIQTFTNVARIDDGPCAREASLLANNPGGMGPGTCTTKC